MRGNGRNSLGSLLSNITSLSLGTDDKRINIATELLGSSESRKCSWIEGALLVLEEDEGVGEIDAGSSESTTERQSRSNGSAT